MGDEINSISDRELSYDEMIEYCRTETKRRVSETISLCSPFMDTPEGRLLMEEQIYGVVIQMLAYVRANTVKMRKNRQREGIEAARANGVQLGRRQKFVADNYADIFARLKNGEIDKKTARAEIGASPNTFARLMREAGEKGYV